jgi:hypothetical protein
MQAFFGFLVIGDALRVSGTNRKGGGANFSCVGGLEYYFGTLIYEKTL